MDYKRKENTSTKSNKKKWGDYDDDSDDNDIKNDNKEIKINTNDANIEITKINNSEPKK